jgi:hypothetical protein
VTIFRDRGEEFMAKSKRAAGQSFGEEQNAR